MYPFNPTFFAHALSFPFIFLIHTLILLFHPTHWFAGPLFSLHHSNLISLSSYHSPTSSITSSHLLFPVSVIFQPSLTLISFTHSYYHSLSISLSSILTLSGLWSTDRSAPQGYFSFRKCTHVPDNRHQYCSFCITRPFGNLICCKNQRW